MALWICNSCGAAYSVDAPACPQCGGVSYRADYEPEQQEAWQSPPAAPPTPGQEPAAAAPAPPVTNATE